MTSFSRGMESSPLGKLTSELPKTRIPDETLDGATRLAREAGMTLSEWVRTLVMIRVHGLSMVAESHTDRLKSVAGMDPKEEHD